MANRAIEWESGQHVVGIGSSVVIRNVARIAIGRCGGKAGVVVTLVALQSGVRASQRERSFRVIEYRTRPIGCRVASGAIGAKAGGYVIWIVGAVVIGDVARIAGSWCTVEDIVDVTQVARHRSMRAGERERRIGVIEGGTGPVRGAVTDRTIHREPRGRVIGIRGAVVERNVAGIAIGRRAGKDVIHMALCTSNRSVRAG